MQPQTAPNGQRQDGFTPKYRHFPPTDRVWVKNPFEHDIVYQVADEYNRPFRYRLPCKDRNGNLGCISELPGGAIATLGVKQIVDELIQNDSANNENALLMWDARVRAKHEAEIIVKIASVAPKADASNPGEINLGGASDDIPTDAPEAPAPPEEAFPGLNQPEEPSAPVAAPSLPPAAPAPQRLPQEADQGIRDVVAASLPSANATAAANGDNPNAEG